MKYIVTEMQLGVLTGLSNFEDREQYIKNEILVNPVIEDEFVKVCDTKFTHYEIRHIREIMKSNIIMAIKDIRLKKGIGLKEAKDIVDYLRDNNVN